MAEAAAEVSEEDKTQGPLPKRQRTTSSTRKHTGASVYKSKYKACWEKKWPFVTAVKHHLCSFYCKYCLKIVSCGHQGESDVTRHISSASHKNNSKSIQNTSTLSFAYSGSVNKVT